MEIITFFEPVASGDFGCLLIRERGISLGDREREVGSGRSGAGGRERRSGPEVGSGESGAGSRERRSGAEVRSGGREQRSGAEVGSRRSGAEER